MLLLLKLIVRDHDNLFVLAEVAHFSGIGFLLYKLSHVESCEGARRCAAPRARTLFSRTLGLLCDNVTRHAAVHAAALSRALHAHAPHAPPHPAPRVARTQRLLTLLPHG